MGLFAFLFGCGRRGDYRMSSGSWYYGDVPVRLATTAGFTPLVGPFARARDHGYYRGVVVEASDGPTFVALSDHYAKDRARVYYGDTYRKGQEYWAYRYTRVVAIDGADVASFQALDAGYAKDARRVYFEGAPFAVADAPSFALLGDGFARDRVAGYYQRRAVPGTDGATFAVLGDHHARDRAHAYYVELVPARDRGMTLSVVRIDGVDLASFVVLERGYARDTARAYYQGHAIEGADGATFRVLVSGADRASDGADAADARHRYVAGHRATS